MALVVRARYYYCLFKSRIWQNLIHIVGLPTFAATIAAFVNLILPTVHLDEMVPCRSGNCFGSIRARAVLLFGKGISALFHANPSAPSKYRLLDLGIGPYHLVQQWLFPFLGISDSTALTYVG